MMTSLRLSTTLTSLHASRGNTVEFPYCDQPCHRALALIIGEWSEWININKVDTGLYTARWPRGMILASGARGAGFESRTSPLLFGVYDQSKSRIDNFQRSLTKSLLQASRPKSSQG